jgi:hypothetical protein
LAASKSLNEFGRNSCCALPNGNGISSGDFKAWVGFNARL